MNAPIIANSKKCAIRGLDTFRGRFYDFVHHVDTYKFVSRAAMHIESDNKQFGLPYQRTPFRTIATLLSRLTWSEEAAFVDFGCGKGLTLLAAARHPFANIIGVEYSSDLAALAQQNVLRYRGRLRSKDKIAVVHRDATLFEFPNTPLVCYFYNPFQPVVLEKVLDNLALSIRQYPREVQLIFHVRYPPELVRNIFEILRLDIFPYYHVYHLGAVRNGRKITANDDASWELVDTDSPLA